MDTFVQARVDNTGADRLQRLSQALGVATQYAQNEQEAAQAEEIAQAEREIEQGVAAGMLQDGRQIREGNLDAVDSPYFRRGVEVGNARAAALRLGLELDNRRTQATLDGNPPPTDPEGYFQWRAEQMAQIEEEMGLDVASMSPLAQREYAGSLSEAQAQDGQRQRSYARERLFEEAYSSFDTELMAIWQGHEDSGSALEATLEAISGRYAMGLDGTELKSRVASAVIAEANRTNNPRLLDSYMEQGELMSTQLTERLTDERRAIQNRVDRDLAARQQAAEDAQEEAMVQMLDSSALTLAVNPFQPVPPEVVNMGEEAVTRWSRLQNAMISNRENRHNPAIEAVVLDGVYNLARRDGGSSSARQELDQALVDGQISSRTYASASQQIRTYEQNAGEMSNPRVNAARSRLRTNTGDQGMTNDDQLLEIERMQAFDILMLDRLEAWRSENPEIQVVPESVLIRLSRDTVAEITDASHLGPFATPSDITRSRDNLRTLVSPDESSEDRQQTRRRPGFDQ